MRKLFVANLSYSMSDDDLRDVFAEKGRVLSARIATDRETGRSRGFGFVEMESEQNAQEAISSLSGQLVHGREIKVMEAQQDRRPEYRPRDHYVRREDRRDY